MSRLNNKGFAITTIIYSVVILLMLVIFSTISIVKKEYDNEKQFNTDIIEELTECLQNGGC